MAVQDRAVLVLFGSETGNAQDMAEETGRVCQRLHFKSRVEELNKVDLVRFCTVLLALLLFVLLLYGTD